MTLRYQKSSVLFQEVPNETSLTFFIAGCPMKCKGCHSPELRKNVGTDLTEDHLGYLLDKYNNLITCVCFMGGDWNDTALVVLLNKIKTDYPEIRTCLYTGRNKLNNKKLVSLCDYIKYGPYIEKYGPLTSKTTNQVFLDVKNNKNLNYLFQKERDVHKIKSDSN